MRQATVIMCSMVMLMLGGCMPDGGGGPAPDAGTDATGDRCGGCEHGECIDLEHYGWSCVAECAANRCSHGNYCTYFYGGDFTQYKCTEEPLIDG